MFGIHLSCDWLRFHATLEVLLQALLARQGLRQVGRSWCRQTVYAEGQKVVRLAAAWSRGLTDVLMEVGDVGVVHRKRMRRRRH